MNKNNDNKLENQIEELEWVVKVLSHGDQVLIPVGKHLSYNLLFDKKGTLFKFPQDISKDCDNQSKERTDQELDPSIKGEIAELKAIILALKLGWGVLKLAAKPWWHQKTTSKANQESNQESNQQCEQKKFRYDLVFDIEGDFVKVQVKSAWYEAPKKRYVATNKCGHYKNRQANYTKEDFHFAMIYVGGKYDIFFVMESELFIAYSSNMTVNPTYKDSEENGEVILNGTATKLIRINNYSSKSKPKKYKDKEYSLLYAKEHKLFYIIEKGDLEEIIKITNKGLSKETEEKYRKWCSILKLGLQHKTEQAIL